MATPKVSIVVPAYKAEKTVGETLESIKKQTYTNWEVLLINDCSPDSTLALLEAAAAADGRFRVYTNEKNSGVSYSRNRGVQLARGEWIAFLDSDDFWAPEKLEKQLALADETGADIVYTGYQYVDAAGKPVAGYFSVPQNADFSAMLKKNVMSTSGMMIRRELLLQYPFQRDVGHEDLYEWLTLLKAGAIAVGIDEPLHTLRIFQKESRSGNKVHAAVNRMRLYQQMKIPLPAACWYWICYVWNALNKYSGIHSK